MKTVQEVFNKVIEGEYYHPAAARYMCEALMRARELGIITEQEDAIAHQEINKYLREELKSNANSLKQALIENDLPHDCQDLLDIYRNWENRPCFKTINGFKVLSVNMGLPKVGEEYVYPSAGKDGFRTGVFFGDIHDCLRLGRGLIYPNTEKGRKAAKSHMLALKGTYGEVCEWTLDGTDTYSCTGLIRPQDCTYCPDCGRKVRIKPKMCTLGGIEFPLPRFYNLDGSPPTKFKFSIGAADYFFDTEEDKRAFRDAVGEAIHQAMKEAK